MNKNNIARKIPTPFLALFFLLLGLTAFRSNAEIGTLPRTIPEYGFFQTYDQQAYSSLDEAASAGCNPQQSMDSSLDCNALEISFGGNAAGPSHDKYWIVTARAKPPNGWYQYSFVVFEITSKECPTNSTLKWYGRCECKFGFGEAYDPVLGQGLGSCIAYSDLEDPNIAEARPEEDDAGMCTPNPIIPATGVKYRNELDWIDTGPAPLSFSRIYRSSWSSETQPASGLGPNW